MVMTSASPYSEGDGTHTTSTDAPERSLSSGMGVLLHPKTTVLAESGSMVPVSFVITHPDGLERVHVPGQADSVELDDSSCAWVDAKRVRTRQMARAIFFMFLSVISLMKGIDKFQQLVFVIVRCRNFLLSEDCICGPWLLHRLRLFLHPRNRKRK